MSTADKLNKLIETKEAIRQSIIAKGTDVGTDVPFSQYPSKINEIQTGSGGGDSAFYDLRTKGGTDLTGLFSHYAGGGNDLDLTSLDVSNATIMDYFFKNMCDVPNVNCTNWNLDKVTNVNEMLSYVDSTIDVSNWRFNSVTNAYMPFYMCRVNRLIGLENRNLFPNATNFESLFYYSKCKELDLSKWDISKVVNMTNLFFYAEAKKLDLTNWNTQNVKYMDNAFAFEAYSTNKIEELLIPDWDMTGLEYCNSLFGWDSSHTEKLKYIDMSRCNEATLTMIAQQLYARTPENISEISIPANSSETVNNAFIEKYWRPLNQNYNIESASLDNLTYNEIKLNSTSKVLVNGLTPWYADPNDIKFISTDESIVTVDGDVLSSHGIGDVTIKAIDKRTEEEKGSINISSVENYLNTKECVFKMSDDIDYPPTEIYINSTPYPLEKIDNYYRVSIDDDIKCIQFPQQLKDIIKLNTSRMETTETMFMYSDISNIDLEYFDTSNVTNMGQMFYGSPLETITGLANWNTSKVTNTGYMFYGCDKLKSIDLSSWDISNINSYYGMFYNCQELEEIDISNWNFTHDMDSMCISCYNLKSIKFNNASQFYYIRNIITNSGSRNGIIHTTCNIDDIGSYVISDLAYLGWTVESSYIPEEPEVPDEPSTYKLRFKATDNTGSIEINGSTINVSDLINNGDNEYAYNPGPDVSITSVKFNSSKITELIKLDVSNVTIMTRMFEGCSSLTSLDVSNWDVSNVTIMTRMFYGCSSLTSLDVSNWDTSKITALDSAFYGCSSLTSLDVSNWDTSKVVSTTNIFGDCSKLTSITCNVITTINRLASQLPSSNGTIHTTCNPADLDLTTIESKGWTVQSSYQA